MVLTNSPARISRVAAAQTGKVQPGRGKPKGDAMTDVNLDVETLDRITVAGIKYWRKEVMRCESKHPDDIRQNRLLVAAADILLAYVGETP